MTAEKARVPESCHPERSEGSGVEGDARFLVASLLGMTAEKARLPRG